VGVGLPHVSEDGLSVRDPPGGMAVGQEKDHGLDPLQHALLLHVRHDRQGLHCSEHVHGSPNRGEGSSLTNQGP
jgi:hypothetical protein